MEKEREEEKQAIGTTPDVAPQPARKIYRAPELVEWGSIKDLTRGAPGKETDGGFLGSLPA